MNLEQITLPRKCNRFARGDKHDHSVEWFIENSPYDKFVVTKGEHGTFEVQIVKEVTVTEQETKETTHEPERQVSRTGSESGGSKGKGRRTKDR